ncbi:MAG: hypothetical protein UT90_C0001G0014 [Parcubacteria group bacterium GW2011_GWA1_40_21]|nr:MAG: hypothetical protein UT90_C0001G0014 [Parcubacteria group bacterium GW2011_GWA1_40_21]
MSHLLATIESKFVPILIAKSNDKIEDPDKRKRHRELYAGNSANARVPKGDNLSTMQTISREDLQTVLRKSSLGGGRNRHYIKGMGE